MNDINALLMSSARTAACNVLIALLILGPAPVAGGEIATTCQIDAASASRSLDVLLNLGLVGHDGTGRYRTNWRLTPSGRRLTMAIFSLAQAVPETMFLPAALPLVDGSVDNPVDNPAPDPLQADAPTLLHAGEPATNPKNSELPNYPSNQGTAAGFSNPKNSDLQNDSVVIVLKEKEINTLKTTPIPGQPNPKNSDLQKAQAELERRRQQSHTAKQTRLIRNIAAALVDKGRPAVIDDAANADLRTIADRLVSAGCRPERAQEAVTNSPWTAEQMQAQLDVWFAYKQTPQARTITAHGFPYLVAARLERGVPCPAEISAAADDEHRFDEFLAAANGDVD